MQNKEDQIADVDNSGKVVVVFGIDDTLLNPWNSIIADIFFPETTAKVIDHLLRNGNRVVLHSNHQSVIMMKDMIKFLHTQHIKKNPELWEQIECYRRNEKIPKDLCEGFVVPEERGTVSYGRLSKENWPQWQRYSHEWKVQLAANLKKQGGFGSAVVVDDGFTANEPTEVLQVVVPLVPQGNPLVPRPVSDNYLWTVLVPAPKLNELRFEISQPNSVLDGDLVDENTWKPLEDKYAALAAKVKRKVEAKDYVATESSVNYSFLLRAIGALSATMGLGIIIAIIILVPTTSVGWIAAAPLILGLAYLLTGIYAFKKGVPVKAEDPDANWELVGDAANKLDATESALSSTQRLSSVAAAAAPMDGTSGNTAATQTKPSDLAPEAHNEAPARQVARSNSSPSFFSGDASAPVDAELQTDDKKADDGNTPGDKSLAP